MDEYLRHVRELGIWQINHCVPFNFRFVDNKKKHEILLTNYVTDMVVDGPLSLMMPPQLYNTAMWQVHGLNMYTRSVTHLCNVENQQHDLFS